jgi:hypothetical protein
LGGIYPFILAKSFGLSVNPRQNPLGSVNAPKKARIFETSRVAEDYQQILPSASGQDRVLLSAVCINLCTGLGRCFARQFCEISPLLFFLIASADIWSALSNNEFGPNYAFVLDLDVAPDSLK